MRIDPASRPLRDVARMQHVDKLLLTQLQLRVRELEDRIAGLEAKPVEPPK